MDNENYLISIIERLEKQIYGGDDATISREIEHLTDMFAIMVYNQHTHKVYEAYEKIERLYSILLTDSSYKNERVTAQLEVLVVLFAQTSLLVDRKEVESALVEGASKNILLAIYRANKPLTNQEIAQATGYREETIARNISKLRNVGLISCFREWRNKFNQLTDIGREKVEIIACCNKSS